MWKVWHKLFGWHYVLFYDGNRTEQYRAILSPNGILFIKRKEYSYSKVDYENLLHNGNVLCRPECWWIPLTPIIINTPTDTQSNQSHHV